jgi:nicotinamide mononucleotide (NMN) deamidase PncC
MRNRLAKTFLTTMTIAAVAVPGVAQAKHGADDPVGHVRHAVHHTTKAKAKAKHHRHHRHHHARHGADDGANHR